jgi:hypothetical protein
MKLAHTVVLHLRHAHPGKKGEYDNILLAATLSYTEREIGFIEQTSESVVRSSYRLIISVQAKALIAEDCP